MRRKAYLSLMLIIVLLFAAFPAQAATERRGLVEFCDLYALRMIKNSNEEFRAFVGPGPYDKMGTETEYYMYTGAGNLMVDKETFHVNSVHFNLMKINDNSHTEYIDRCAAVIAALEFSQVQEDMIDVSIASGRKPKEDPVWDQAIDIVNTISYDIIAGASSMQQLQSGQEIPIFTRNYKYYVQYRLSSAGIGFIDIIARAQ